MSQCSIYCKGCFYRSTNRSFPCCDYLIKTGKLRGCPPGEGCIRKTTKRDIKRQDIAIKPTKQKRVRLSDAERREHRNALKRRQYANKKTALSTANTENGEQKYNLAQ